MTAGWALAGLGVLGAGLWTLSASGHCQIPCGIYDDPMRFRRATIQAVLRFKRSRPWSGSDRERKRKFRRLDRVLCRI